MPLTKSEKIWMDGELVPWDDAKIHILTHTLHYGCGVFEGIRAYATSQGPAVFRLTDHKGAMNVLAATHEEIFAVLAQELNSHKQLPQAWYQFQTKFRDEARPRAGLLRVREFTMKDSYSFDLDPGGLDESFNRHRDAYCHLHRL